MTRDEAHSLFEYRDGRLHHRTANGYHLSLEHLSEGGRIGEQVMFFIDGKPLDLTKQQPGMSIQLKPGGSITQSQNGVTQSVINNTTQLKPLHELVKMEHK